MAPKRRAGRKTEEYEIRARGTSRCRGRSVRTTRLRAGVATGLSVGWRPGGNHLQLRDEAAVFCRPRLLVGHPEQERG
jgi:hypothetical protein